MMPFKIYKTRRCDLNFPCAWIYYPGINRKKCPRIAKISRKLPNGRRVTCYLQIRKIDSTICDHPFWKNKCIQDDIKQRRNIILLSEHYRNILEIDDVQFKSCIEISINIDEAVCPVKIWFYKIFLAWQHPEASVMISLQLGILAFF